MDELVHRWRQHKLTVIKDKERRPRVGLGNRFSEYKISRKKHGRLVDSAPCAWVREKGRRDNREVMALEMKKNVEQKHQE